MRIKQKIQETIQTLLGLQSINVFIEKNERRIMDLEKSCDDFEDTFEYLKDEVDDLSRKEILDYDSDDFIHYTDFEELESDHRKLKDNYKDLELAIDKLEQVVCLLAEKADIPEVKNILKEGKE